MSLLAEGGSETCGNARGLGAFVDGRFTGGLREAGVAFGHVAFNSFRLVHLRFV